VSELKSLHASYIPNVISVDRAGSCHCCTDALRSAPVMMSIPQTSLIFFISVVLIPIPVGFFVWMNPTI